MGIPAELGPVEYIVVEFENGTFDGSALAELASLQDRGVIRVLDLLFIHREQDGAVAWLDYDGVAPDGDLEVGSLGADMVELLSEADAAELGADLAPGQALAVLVFEDTWAVTLQQRLGNAGGRLVEASRVPKDAVDAALAYAAQETEEVG